MNKFFENNSKKILITSLSLILISVILLIGNFNNLNTTQNAISHANKLLLATNQSLAYMENSESSFRDYIISPKLETLNSFNQNVKSLVKTQENIELLAGDSIQSNLIQNLKEGTVERIAVLKQGVYIRDSQGFDAAKIYLDSRIGSSNIEELRGITYQIQNDETQALSNQQKSFLGLYQAIYGLFLTLSTITALFIFLNFFIFRKETNKLVSLEFNKDAVISSVAHDFYLKHQAINNLIDTITPVLTYADQKTKNIFNELKLSSNDTLTLAENFKNLLSLERGNLKIFNERIDLLDMLDSLEIKYDSDKDFEPYILGDRNLLSRAFLDISKLIKPDSKLTIKKKSKDIAMLIPCLDSIDLKPLIEQSSIGEEQGSNVGLFYAMQLIKKNKGKIFIEDKNLIKILFPLDLYKPARG